MEAETKAFLRLFKFLHHSIGDLYRCLGCGDNEIPIDRELNHRAVDEVGAIVCEVRSQILEKVDLEVVGVMVDGYKEGDDWSGFWKMLMSGL